MSIFLFFFNAFLAILFFIEIFNYEKSNKIFSISKVVIKTKWLKYTLIIGFFLCVLWGISLWYFGDSYVGFTKYYPLWIGISIFIYWIAYSSIFHTTIFKQQLNIRKNTSLLTPKPQRAVVSDTDSKKKTNIDLFGKAEGLIIDEKLYLNLQVSLDLIANRLNISTNYLSQIINNHSSSSFPDYINTKRIELAKKILVNPDFNKYTILSIAFETGFNSKSSFYSAFKKATKLTPTQFKNGR